MEYNNIYKNKNISVIVPFFNEKRIEQNIEIIDKELKNYFQNYEIIVVSDGSTDKSYENALKHACEKIKIYHYEKNVGKGYALKYGFSKSKGEYISFIDGDLELSPGDIKNFLVLMEIYDADIVIGSKRHPFSKLHIPIYRRFVSFGYQLFIRIFLNISCVRDSQVGLKLSKRKVLEAIFPKILCKKYAFDAEFLAVASHLGYKKILEAPVQIHRETNGKPFVQEIVKLMKMTWQMFIDTCAVFYRLRILKYYDREIEKPSDAPFDPEKTLRLGMERGRTLGKIKRTVTEESNEDTVSNREKIRNPKQIRISQIQNPKHYDI